MSCVRMSPQMSIPLTSVLLLAGAAWLFGCGENAVGQSETKAPGIERTQEGKWSYMVVEFELPKIDDNTWRVGAAATLAFTTQMNGLAGHGWEYVGPVNDAHVLPQHGLYYVAFRRLKNGPGANFARAWTAANKGDYRSALELYAQAIRLREDYEHAHYQLAWLLATCPADGVRDGKRAVEHARRACELTNWEDASSLDTLAAANAEAGSFDDAIRWARQAVDLTDDPQKKQEISARLDLYESRRPYRESPLSLEEG